MDNNVYSNTYFFGMILNLKKLVESFVFLNFSKEKQVRQNIFMK